MCHDATALPPQPDIAGQCPYPGGGERPVPPLGWEVHTDDGRRIHFVRVVDHVALWHNPRHLAEVIVHYHWEAIPDLPFPHEHWEPSAELLAIATAPIKDRVIWQWAIDMAAAPGDRWLQE